MENFPKYEKFSHTQSTRPVALSPECEMTQKLTGPTGAHLQNRTRNFWPQVGRGFSKEGWNSVITWPFWDRSFAYTNETKQLTIRIYLRWQMF